jgi:hypothetical protein
MHICDDEDIAMLSLPPADRALYDRIEKGLSDLRKQMGEQDGITKRLQDMVAEVAAINKRHAEDAALVAEFRKTGVTPAAVYQREGIKRAAYLSGSE